MYCFFGVGVFWVGVFCVGVSLVFSILWVDGWLMVWLYMVCNEFVWVVVLIVLVLIVVISDCGVCILV